MTRALSVMVLALALAGCGSLSNEMVTDIQAKAAGLCNFVPTPGTVTAVVGTLGGPYAGVAGGMIVFAATAMCKAKTEAAAVPLGLKSADEKPECPYGRVEGICLEGALVEAPPAWPDDKPDGPGLTEPEDSWSQPPNGPPGPEE